MFRIRFRQDASYLMLKPNFYGIAIYMLTFLFVLEKNDVLACFKPKDMINLYFWQCAAHKIAHSLFASFADLQKSDSFQGINEHECVF